MRFCPDRLILLDRAENALFEIDRELRERWVGAQLITAVADVCDMTRIGQVFEQYKPQVIFHAAAHKHVPMMEHNSGEAVKNNVFGTKVVADAALAHVATAFVLISTDKAVRPTSVMGATEEGRGVVCSVAQFERRSDEATKRRRDCVDPSCGIDNQIPRRPLRQRPRPPPAASCRSSASRSTQAVQSPLRTRI